MTDLLSGVPPMPQRDGPPAEAPSADRAIAENLKAIERAKAPPLLPPPAPGAEQRVGRHWWEGRTFYACRCGARDERTNMDPHHPDTLPCWHDKCDGTMTQWTPPMVERERLRHG